MSRPSTDESMHLTGVESHAGVLTFLFLHTRNQELSITAE